MARTQGSSATASRFDLGPSTLTLPAVYRDLFLKTGRGLEDSVDLRGVDPAFGYRFADGSAVTLPGAGVGACATALQGRPRRRCEPRWRALLKAGRRIWSHTRSDVLGRPLDGYRDLLPLASRRSLRTVAPWQTLRGLGRATCRTRGHG